MTKEVTVNNSMALLDYRDIVMIAGKDSYAHQGIENISPCYIRPSGEGGCMKRNPKYNDET